MAPMPSQWLQRVLSPQTFAPRQDELSVRDADICLGPYGGPWWGGLFLMSEVPLWQDELSVRNARVRQLTAENS